VASNDRRCINYRRAGERLAADRHGGLRLVQICVCGSVRFRPEQICAVTDSVSEQQRSVRSISTEMFHHESMVEVESKCQPLRLRNKIKLPAWVVAVLL